jgi:hypothetical protein
LEFELQLSILRFVTLRCARYSLPPPRQLSLSREASSTDVGVARAVAMMMVRVKKMSFIAVVAG